MRLLEKIWSQICVFFAEHMMAPIKEMGWVDVVDILLLAVILYALYCFLRTRRAGRVLLGLSLVVVVSVLVTVLELPALSYIVRLFAASAFFCIVVIFQPEFRDALERLGNSRLINPGKNRLGKKKFDMTRDNVEEVVDAVGKMAETRTGALIVFEGLTKLGDYIQVGKPVDAALHSHTLRNLFYDKAPLHDGAVIVRNQRIHSASCVLPSAKGNLDFAAVGTRHRAAVGLTEVSDALVVVVSEETGIVSVAQDGKLTRDIDRKMLYDMLMTFLAGEAYIRYQKANLKKHYGEALDSSVSIKNRRQKHITRFNTPREDRKPEDELRRFLDESAEMTETQDNQTDSKGGETL